MSNNTQNNNDWFKKLIELCLSKLPPIYMFLVTIIAVVFLGQQPNSQTCSVKTPPSFPISRADYERLQPGMSRIEVESILGRGIEIERSLTTTTFKWENLDCSSITAIFENGNLVSKHQSNLQ